MIATLRLSALTLLAVAVVLGLVSCGDGPDSPSTATVAKTDRTLVLASSDFAVGQHRLTFVVLDGSVPLTDEPTYVRFFKKADTKGAQLVAGAAIPWVPIGAEESAHGGPAHEETGLTGIYYVNITFDEAGVWGLGVTVGDKLDIEKEIRVQFTVKQKSEAPVIGEKAIAVTNATERDKPLKQIHTGSDADPRFHSLMVADAITSGKPSVIVFATPSFCRTRTCGPSLQVAIRAEEKYGDRTNFIHIEPYELDDSGNLVNDDKGNSFKPAKEGIAWGLPTEPWVFVVDKAGRVTARFDGPYAFEELDYSLSLLAAQGG